MAVQVTLPQHYTDNTGHQQDLDLIEMGVRIGDEVLYEASLELDSLGVVINPFLNTPDPAHVGQYIPFTNGRLYVTEVVSAQVFKFEGYNADGTVGNVILDPTTAPGGGPAYGNVSYSILRHLDKNDQIADLQAVASAFANKRVNLIWPDAGEVIDDNGDAVLVDGSFLCACLAGAKSAYPAQQSFTNLGFPGPYKLRHSNDYFTKLQLDDLSSSGVNVIVQDADGAQVYSRHQRTTDVGIFENSELSIVTAVDKVSLDLIETLKPYIGKYNITDDFLNFVADASTAYLYVAKSEKAPMCGPLIIDGKVVSVRAQLHGQNLDVPSGSIELTIAIEVPKPANYINIKLLVS